MPREMNSKNVAIFLAVIGGFALAVVLALYFRAPDRAIGCVLILVGLGAILFAQSVSDAKQSIGERWPLWPGANMLRPFTVRLWGFAVVVLGAMMAGGL
jgi:hypothetical protein